MAALVRDGMVLLAHRHPDRRWYPNCWDLAGGHIEAGESPEDAVRRECQEELGVVLAGVRPLDVDFTDLKIEPYAFVVTEWTGDPVNAAPDEHDELAWFAPDQLEGLVLADGSYPRLLARAIHEASHEASQTSLGE